MNGEIGTVLLIVALCLALTQAIFPLWLAKNNGAHYVTLARSAAYGQSLFIAIAFGLLIYCFVIGDYSVLYVAINSNANLPTMYRVSATWGGHEGSLLLWVLCLNLWTIAVCVFSKQLPARYTARIIGVMGLISVGFILFILVTSNPFTPQYYDYFNLSPDFIIKFKTAVANSSDPALMTVLDKYGFTPSKVLEAKSPNSSLLMLQFVGGSTDSLQAMLVKYNLGNDFKVSSLYASLQRRGDLNPLLQDFGLIVHPPLLYMGYVGFSVAFSFAIAALLGGKLDSSWARWSRPWTTMAWVFLTCGIALGSWWAYYELGWGGWWFWDPVENASFMPWLVGTALIHSLAVTEKRGAFQTWTVFLAIIAFSLSLLGTFLVRSGILNSVHSFASDPGRGLFILAYLFIVIGGSLALYASHAPNIKSTGTFKEFSREGSMMLNNVILMVVTATVLIGTLYPVFLSAVIQQDISIGPSWFNWFFVKMMMPLAFLAGLGPLMKWKNQSLRALVKQTTPYLLISIAIGLVYWFYIAGQTLDFKFKAYTSDQLTEYGIIMSLFTIILIVRIIKFESLQLRSFIVKATPILLGILFIGSFIALFVEGPDNDEWFIAIAIGLSAWIVLATGEMVFYRARKMKSFKRAVNSLKLGTIGMMLAHIGIAVFIIGATFASTRTVKEDIKIAPGESFTMKGHEFKLVSVRWLQGVNYNAYEGQFYVFKGKKLITILSSQKRYYHSQSKNSRMTEAGIDGGVTRDLFVSMGNPVNNFIHTYLSSYPKTVNGKRVLIGKKQIDIINETLKRTAWIVRIQHKPFVRWIWIGAIFMALGGLLAALDKRYRIRKTTHVNNTDDSDQEINKHSTAGSPAMTATPGTDTGAKP